MKRLLFLLSILITSSFAFYIQANLLKDNVFPGEIIEVNVTVFADEDLKNEPLVIHTDFGFKQERTINLTKGHVYSFVQEILVPSELSPGVYNITIFGRFYKKTLALHVIERPLNISLTPEKDYIKISISAKKDVKQLHVVFSCENGAVISINQSVLKSGESIERTVKCSAGTLTLTYDYFGKRKEERVVEKRTPFPWQYVLLGAVLLFIFWKFFRR